MMSLALVNLLSRSSSLSIHSKAMITIKITAIVMKENRKVIRPRALPGDAYFSIRSV